MIGAMLIWVCAAALNPELRWLWVGLAIMEVGALVEREQDRRAARRGCRNHAGDW